MSLLVDGMHGGYLWRNVGFTSVHLSAYAIVINLRILFN